MVVSTIYHYSLKRITASWAIIWSGVWIAGAVAVFFSKRLDAIGQFVIGDEGKQLVIYGCILMLFYIAYKLFLYVNQINAQMTRLVEELAKKK